MARQYPVPAILPTVFINETAVRQYPIAAPLIMNDTTPLPAPPGGPIISLIT